MLKKLGISAAVSLLSLPAIASDEAKELEIVEVSGKKESNGLNLNGKNSASNRLGLTALETPASIEVLSEESIAIKGDHASLSAVTRAAGFASSASPGNGGSSVAVRGFNGHSAVAQTYDGIRLFVGAGTVTFPTDTWTIEKIEVLRGPGSIINGIGAIGATINYTPKSPKFTDIENELDVTVGSFGLRRLALDSGGEVNSGLAYRVSAVNHSTDGYADNSEETRNVIAGSLLFRPNDDLDIKLTVDYSDVDAPPYFGAPVDETGKVPERFRKSNYNVKDGLVEYEDLWPRVEVKWEISDTLTFRSNSYYLDAQRHWKNAEKYEYKDADDQIIRSTHYEILHDQNQLGTRNDLLLALDFGGMKSKLNVGFELNDVEFTHTNSFDQGEQSETISPDSKVQNTWEEDGMGPATKAYSTDTFQYAIFVDNHLEINDNYSVVAGLRHDTIDFKRKNFRSGDKLSFDVSGTSWRLGLVYQPSENTSFYAQTSSAVDGTESPITMRKPERKLAKGKQLELGVKQSAFEDKLQLTLAVFDIEKNNLVVKEGSVERQVGQQSSRGIELNLFAQALDSLDIEFNATYVNPEYDDFSKGGVDLGGNRPKNVPERTANLWTNWVFVEGWKLSGGVRYVGERFVNDENTNKLPEYTVFDASLNWVVNNDLQLALRAKNLTDEIDYVLSPYSNGNQWILGDGRSVELGLNYSF